MSSLVSLTQAVAVWGKQTCSRASHLTVESLSFSYSGVQPMMFSLLTLTPPGVVSFSFMGLNLFIHH